MTHIMTDVIYKGLYEPEGKNVDIPKNRLSWEHLCLYYGTRIVRSNLMVSSTEATLYEVPAGKVFLLITANLSMQNEKTGNETGRLYLFDGSATTRMLTCLTGGGTNMNGSQQSVSFMPACPVRMVAGENINLTHTETSGSTWFEGDIFGYEIDAAIFYRES